MANFDFWVDIENSSGTKLGSGPLQSVTNWTYTARFDRAGTISFTMAASDPQASIVTNRAIVRAWALIDGVRTEVGAGIIDNIETTPGNNGAVSLRVSGLDLIRELSYRSVGNLEVGEEFYFGSHHALALAEIGALAPAGWTFTPASLPGFNYVYGRFAGESVLGALVWLAERTKAHFYRASGRELVFLGDFVSSGIRAIQANGPLAAETCAIVSLKQTIDTYDLLTRITPYGSGQGRARLTLAATSRVDGDLPAGYSFSAANNYIENDTATSTYGLVNHPEIEFPDIGPIANTDADLEAAANMLFDAASQELQRRSTIATQRTYTLTIAGCSALLRPLQMIRIVYRDPSQNIDIDEDLYILEATWQLNADGVRTSQLVVSTDDRWPSSDTGAIVERLGQGRMFKALPQMNANAYVLAFTKSLDDILNAEFRFRFGPEVVQLNQVTFEFQILPLESTVAGGASTSSGASSATTSAGGSSHTHPIPDHQHLIAVTGSSAAAAALMSTSGGLGFLEKASAGNVTISTTNSGGTTSSSESTHTHNIAHTHTFTPLLTYGIYRNTGGEFALSDLEYSLDTSTWYAFSGGVNGYVSLGSGWHQVDLTALLYDSTTFRPLSASNVLYIRRKAAGAIKKATIDAQLSVRNIIQAISYS